MWTIKRICTLILTGVLSNSCTTSNNNTEQLAPYRAQLSLGNDRILNDRVLNDRTLNDRTLNDKILNDRTLNDKIFSDKIFDNKVFNGFSLNGTKIENITIDGSLLKGTWRGKSISGSQFEGAMLEVNFADPQAIDYKFRIENVSLDKSAAAEGYKDIWRYQISTWNSKDKNWTSMCTDDNGQPTDLIPLLGMYWDQATGNRIDDDQSLTLACKGGALEKCTHIGYRPWATAFDCTGLIPLWNCSQVSLRDYHQACTRMLRADYCGNGVSYTVTGTLLDIYDYLDPPITLREELWQTEARWTAAGAMCLSKPRHPELWAGGCPDPNQPSNLLKLPKCNPYESNRGMIVSTFDTSK